MPFPYPMQPYTKDEVFSLNPNQMGVYGIFRGSICVYVGSGDIRERMLDHLNNDNPCINLHWPNQWTAVVTPYYLYEERRLILEYEPLCNKRVG